MHNAIVITGQTATGKTDLAIELAKKENGEIINADSRQIYKYLDIITGKDLRFLKESEVPYHLFDIVEPFEEFSSHDYVSAAFSVVADILKRNKTPVIVGGSYMYLKHLLYGFDIAAEPDWKLREELNDKTVEELQTMLSPRPDDINDSDWHNPRRLIRRIEINKSSQTNTHVNKGLYNSTVEFIGLVHKDRESLVSRITQRVENRLKEGAIEEVEQLLGREYKETDPGMKTIGYQQIMKYLHGEYTKDQAIKIWTTREIQYAKRQYTFMKKDANIVWREI